MLPPNLTASSVPASRSAQSSRGSWLPAQMAGRGCKVSTPSAYSACRASQASTSARGNSSLPVTRTQGIAPVATRS